MANQTLRYLIAGALLVHALGHTLGFWMPARSWLLSGSSETTLRTISSVVWTVVAIGFVAACLGFLGIVVPDGWWSRLATASACLSLLGLIVFWGNWPVFNLAGAFAMNIAVVATQVWLRWPFPGMFGK